MFPLNDRQFAIRRAGSRSNLQAGIASAPIFVYKLLSGLRARNPIPLIHGGSYVTVKRNAALIAATATRSIAVSRLERLRHCAHPRHVSPERIPGFDVVRPLGWRVPTPPDPDDLRGNRLRLARPSGSRRDASSSRQHRR
ncbi:hypothetical protein [Burkholderia ubonensis]|uniref:hypothetical protein n=1 Tax=Burkholderia ubonensis TaxID=101571 RepID=UPI00158403B6|nr:hypothetical protein [Burkholderia ubonensis]